jgi:hypothetical protein
LPPAGYHFKLSVLVQQVFSLLKQSPTGGLRFADLRRIAPAEVKDEALRRLLGHLSLLDYVRPGRPGEWRAGQNLNELVDEHEIYSNIGAEALGATIIDAYSGRTIARADRPRRKGETLLMGGRSVEVAWQDRYRVGVERRRSGVEEMMRFHTAPAAISLEVAQGVAARLGLEPGTMLCLPDTMATQGVSTGVWLFHFWGDLYGELLAATLRARFASEEGLPAVSPWNELCLRLPFSLESLPPWDGELVGEQVRSLRRQLEPGLELGRFHALLPPGLATRSVLEHCDLARLEALYRAAKLTLPPARLRPRLQGLLS